MSNTDIADCLDFASKLMELHGEDEFKVKSYASSTYTVSKTPEPLASLSFEELLRIKGIGKSISQVIMEIVKTGTFYELERLNELTPQGVFDVFKVKGLGVKKIKILWKNLGIDSIEKLQAACLDNTIATEKGFGEKTQDSILESIAYLKSVEGKLRMNQAQGLSLQIVEIIKSYFQNCIIVGEVAMNAAITSSLDFLVVKDGFGSLKFPEDSGLIQDMTESSPATWVGKFQDTKTPVRIYKVSTQNQISSQIKYSSTPEHLKFSNSGKTLLQHIENSIFQTEEEAYTTFGIPYIVPEMREGLDEFSWVKTHAISDLVSFENLRGTVHNHSTYSDGSHTLKQMADYAKSMGLSYFGIADHSQTAQYANGLSPQTVLKQHQEIEALNSTFQDFKIFKGIESDILLNGDLDYENQILASFDYVVASVHSVLNMDEKKATIRLLKAIENPYTSILGHLSGRLLLSRNGYPLDYPKIIDACAANKVAIELNASPYRLDIDWKWICRCMDKGVWISINPDAHSMEGLWDMKYGVQYARKGGLTKEYTLNALDCNQILGFFKK
ncbi:MAG: helix-hairpin-helix domain-containing protein [Leadbetterella sp.]